MWKDQSLRMELFIPLYDELIFKELHANIYCTYQINFRFFFKSFKFDHVIQHLLNIFLSIGYSK